MPQTEWPVAFFDDDYLRMYRPLFTPERTAAEVEFIAGSLALEPGASVLDLACGYGRHAIGLARRGHRVTGLDFNPRYLEIAAAEARKAGVASFRSGASSTRSTPTSPRSATTRTARTNG